MKRTTQQYILPVMGLGLLVLGLGALSCGSELQLKNDDDTVSDSTPTPTPTPTPTVDPNKYIFYTATTFTGAAVGGISGADAKCNADSNKPRTASTYKAMIVDGTTRVAKPTATDWVLAANTTYLRASDDATIGTTNADAVFDFPLQNAFRETPADGSTPYRYWSGLSGDWTTFATKTCGGWSSTTDEGIVGASINTDNSALANINWVCGTNNALLLCVEQ